MMLEGRGAQFLAEGPGLRAGQGGAKWVSDCLIRGLSVATQGHLRRARAATRRVITISTNQINSDPAVPRDRVELSTHEFSVRADIARRFTHPQVAHRPE